MAQQAQDDFYKDEEAMAMGFAAALNEEIRDLFRAEADIVQIDEPYLQSSADKAKRFGVAVIDRALEGVTGRTALHICFGYGLLVQGRPAGILISGGVGDRRFSRFRSRPPNPGLIVRCSKNCRTRPSFWECSTFQRARWRRPRQSPNEFAARSGTFQPNAL